MTSDDRMRRWLLLPLSLLLVLATAADAQAPDLGKAYRERRALVIGIDSYLHWKPLGYARRDAEAVGKKLVSLGFRVEYLLDRQATRDAITARLSALSREVVKRDQVLIYFSGHGQTEEGGVVKETLGYIVPVDGRPDDPFQTAISMAQLQVLAKRLHAYHVMFAFDACFSGALLTTTKGPGGTRERTPAYVREMLDTPVRFVLAAGTARQEAFEVGGHGVFTRHFLAALDGAAARPGSAGLVTSEDIGAFVQRAVMEEADRYGRKLTPQVGKMPGQGDGEFLLALRVATLPTEQQRKPDRPDVEEEIRQALGSLTFSSKVPGVEVWIKGADDATEQNVGEIRAGRALVRNNLPAGTYRVRARRGGYRDWEQIVQVLEDRKTDVVIDITPLGPSKTIKGEDGAEMVLVPAGEFWMGSTREEVDGAIATCRKHPDSPTEAQCKDWYERELPRHRVTLDAFYIDRFEVTNALFDRFVRAMAYRTTAEREGAGWTWQQKDGKWQWVQVDGADWRQPSGPRSSSQPTHPVVQVSWHDADAYCRWAGKRLPTEAEWEKAARGADGRRYPWGKDWDQKKANGDMSVRTTKPVGSYAQGVSPYGAHDMAGNVAEWVADWFDKDHYRQSPERNPMGPATGQHRVLRGGSWSNYPFYLRAANRYYLSPDFRSNYVGFRCARGLP